MILTRGTPPDELEGEGRKALSTRRLGDAGGLTQFGAHVHTLSPGQGSSERHWHSAEDELLYVLEGEVTVLDDAGEHVLHPGDAAVWAAGVPNAHTVVNRSGTACRYLMVGSRVPRGEIHYPDIGRICRFEGPAWTMEDLDGNVLKRVP